jgi:uncharacterized Zn finger protein (UPF0148 family)
MARFHCRVCGVKGTFAYDGRHVCPECGSRHVEIALSIRELADYDPLIAARKTLAEDETDTPED